MCIGAAGEPKDDTKEEAPVTGSGWVTMEKEQPRAAAAPMQPRAAPKHFNAVEQAWLCLCPCNTAVCSTTSFSQTRCFSS